MSKQNDDSCLRKTKNRSQHALFLRPVKLLLWISNPLPKNKPLLKIKVSQFNTSQEKLIKTIEHVKKQPLFQKKMADFKGI